MFGYTLWLGLILSFCVSVAAPIFGAPFFALLSLVISVGHMIILSLVGYWVIKKGDEDHRDVGSRLANTGYIHTLIGMTAALIQIGGKNLGIPELPLIIQPIGQALVTSIIGWSLGREFQRPAWGPGGSSALNTRDLDRAFRDLVSYLDAWGGSIGKSMDRLNTAAESFKTRMDGTATKLDDASARVTAAMDAYVRAAGSAATQISENGARLGKTTNAAWEGISASTARLNKDTATAADHAAAAAKEAELLGKELRQVNTSLHLVNDVLAAADALIARMRRAT